MAKKRSTLVKDFSEILERGDLAECKAVFDKCDINAKTSKYGSNAFGQRPLSREFGYWLKQQGCDINLKDYYGDTPVFHQILRYRGNLKLMIELGADVHAIDRSGHTLFHKVAIQGTKEDALCLLEQGLNINEKQHSNNFYSEMFTPLEVLFHQRNARAMELLELVEIFINNGAEVSDRVKMFLKEKGKQFEFYRSDYNCDFIEEDSRAMDSLYALIQVEPPEKVAKHDGVSPIIIEGKTSGECYRKLWDFLVPASGVAKCAQGEVIRIAGKVAGELMDNGGMNWDTDYKKMLDVFLEYVEQGNPLTQEEREDIKRIVKIICHGRSGDEPEKLMDYATKWIMQNQVVLPLISPTYK